MTEQKKKGVKADSYASTFHGENTMGGVTHTAMMYIGPLITNFYIQDPLAKKIVDVIPEEMVSPGFGLDGIADEKAFKSLWDGLKLNESIIDAFCWERLYGGAAIVAVVKDGRALTSPVRVGAQLESLRVYEKTSVKVKDRERNPRKANYGEPVTYTVSPGGEMQEYDIHASRIYILKGGRIPDKMRRQNGGWGVSILSTRLIEAILDYNYCEELATQLLRRKQQAVWKAKGLAELCDDDEGNYAARLRLAQVDDNSGVGRAVGIDADDEEYSVLNSDITGIDTFLDKKMDRVVNYSGIHEIILKNKNVGGVSASQNTALETFYKTVDRRRNEDYRPLLEWLIPLLISDSEWSIRFEPLSMPSEKDQAETFNKNCDSISKLITAEVIDADEGRDTLQAMNDTLKLKAGGAELPPRKPDNTEDE